VVHLTNNSSNLTMLGSLLRNPRFVRGFLLAEKCQHFAFGLSTFYDSSRAKQGEARVLLTFWANVMDIVKGKITLFAL